jgi:flavorubredoxin
MTLFGIFTRRDPKTVKPKSPDTKVYSASDLLKYKNEIDVIVICGGSATDLPEMTPELARSFSVVDSFDTHAKIPEHFARCDMAAAVADAFRYSKLVLATTTYNADIFPFMRIFIDHLAERSFQNRTVALMENGSWAPMAAKVMRGMLEKSKNLTFTETTVKINSALGEDSIAQIEKLAEELL